MNLTAHIRFPTGKTLELADSCFLVASYGKQLRIVIDKAYKEIFESNGWWFDVTLQIGDDKLHEEDPESTFHSSDGRYFYAPLHYTEKLAAFILSHKPDESATSQYKDSWEGVKCHEIARYQTALERYVVCFRSLKRV